MKKSNYLIHILALGCAAGITCSSIFAYAQEPAATEHKSETESVISSSEVPQKTTVTQGIYEIVSAADRDFLLDIRYCTYSEEDSHSVQLFHRLDVNQQKFYLEELPSSFYRITALHSGEALTAEEELIDDKEPGSEDTVSIAFAVSMEEVSREKKITPAEQVWLLKDAGNGAYYLQSRTGGYLTLHDSRAYLGGEVSLQDFTGEDTQKWILDASWISGQDYSDTDLVNPYEADGACEDLELVLYFGEEKEILTAAELAQWTSVTDDHQIKTDFSSITAFTQELADTYNTQGHARRFRTTAGEDITLYRGDFGWKLHVEDTAKRLMESAVTGGTVEVEPVWKHKGVLFTKGDDIGDTYVEIDLINQKVWLYKDGKQLLETDCVTGTYGTDRQTPGGVYSIYYKKSPDVLDGEGYSSYVEYWMPFNGGIGLHDANWRYSFGGDIYLTDGSHGCINLPTEAAKLIYETTYIGYPVVCYN